MVDVAANVRDAWVSFETVIVTAPVVAELYVPSAALVAVTVHVPDDVTDRVAPLSEHPAVPADVREYVTAPLPEPPAVESVRVDPTFTVLSTRVSDAWVSAGPPLLSHVAMYEPDDSRSRQVLLPEPP
jgi:hypothetical protein